MYDKKKEVMEEHSFCLKSIKTSVDFIKLGVQQSTVFAYLVLDKCERRLKRMLEDCRVQKGCEDVIPLLSQELSTVQNQLSDFRVDLIKQNVDLVKLVDAKSYLGMQFQENEKNPGLWFQMVSFLFGNVYENPQQFSQIELNRLTKNMLA